MSAQIAIAILTSSEVLSVIRRLATGVGHIVRLSSSAWVSNHRRPLSINVCFEGGAAWKEESTALPRNAQSSFSSWLMSRDASSADGEIIVVYRLEAGIVRCALARV